MAMLRLVSSQGYAASMSHRIIDAAAAAILADCSPEHFSWERDTDVETRSSARQSARAALKAAVAALRAEALRMHCTRRSHEDRDTTATYDEMESETSTAIMWLGQYLNGQIG